jgi:hypothetical protein
LLCLPWFSKARRTWAHRYRGWNEVLRHNPCWETEKLGYSSPSYQSSVCKRNCRISSILSPSLSFADVLATARFDPKLGIYTPGINQKLPPILPATSQRMPTLDRLRSVGVPGSESEPPPQSVRHTDLSPASLGAIAPLRLVASSAYGGSSYLAGGLARIPRGRVAVAGRGSEVHVLCAQGELCNHGERGNVRLRQKLGSHVE